MEAESLWARLCGVPVPEQYTQAAERARAGLKAAWVALEPATRQELLTVLDARELLARARLCGPEFFRAAATARGLAIVAATVPPPKRAPKATPPAEKTWGGVPFDYEPLSHDEVARRLAA